MDKSKTESRRPTKKEDTQLILLEYKETLDIEKLNRETMNQDKNLWDALENSKWSSSDEIEANNKVKNPFSNLTGEKPLFQRMENVMVCIPGTRLCQSDKTYLPGRGTYERQGYIYSSISGVVEIIKKNGGVNLIEVNSPVQNEIVVPVQGDIVTAQVTIITQQYCKCIIKSVNDTVLNRPYHAVLRKEDVRALLKDDVDIYKSYRPGDFILARILPITEAHTFYLSTAEDELGVAIAYSEHGYPMAPISWTQMQCTKMFSREFRKVARVVPENIEQIIK